MIAGSTERSELFAWKHLETPQGITEVLSGSAVIDFTGQPRWTKKQRGAVRALLAHGRDEWGPRALGRRGILADPRRAGIKHHLNAKIKFRQEFRRFAPVVMEPFDGTYFETLGNSNNW